MSYFTQDMSAHECGLSRGGFQMVSRENREDQHEKKYERAVLGRGSARGNLSVVLSSIGYEEEWDE